MLDALGALLAGSTAALVAAARDEMGAAGLVSTLLVYLPTVLDLATPAVRRANVPLGWEEPAFDVLQPEDYAWGKGGRGGIGRAVWRESGEEDVGSSGGVGTIYT